MPIKSRILFPWVAAAVLAFALPVTPSAWAANDALTIKLLDSQLPQGVNLKKATLDQTADALGVAATQRPDLAPSLLKIAILARRPPPHHGNLPCPDLIKLLRKTVEAVPDDARQLLELAISLDPECADVLTKLLEDPTQLGLSANAFSGNFGFGLGLGNEFPGSPGFTGSPPGGTLALPPVSSQPVLTSDT